MLLPDGYQYAKNMRFMNEKLCVPQERKLGWPLGYNEFDFF
jgi:hypothetical protein